jgi:hypothetical protein
MRQRKEAMNNDEPASNLITTDVQDSIFTTADTVDFGIEEVNR